MAAPQRTHSITYAEIDQNEFTDLKLMGCIILTSFSDKFELYPMEGYPGTGTLQDNLPFPLGTRRITENDRKTPFVFKYLADGEDFEARLFTRVQMGKNLKITLDMYDRREISFLILSLGCEEEYRETMLFYLNREIAGLKGEELTRKYEQLVSTHRGIMFAHWKYQNRTNPATPWSFRRRDVYGADIKYEYVSELTISIRFFN